MSFRNFFQLFFRGWVPEEPKMPKHMFRRIRIPTYALVLSTTAVFTLFSPFVLYISPLVAPPVSMVVDSAPNSTYVKFHGILQDDNCFIILLNNGTQVTTDILTLSLVITETSEDTCVVNVAFESDCFSSEAVVDGRMLDGYLIVDSTRSVFLVNPNMTKGSRIQMFEQGDYVITSYFGNETSHPSTAVEPYGVTAVMIHASQSHPFGFNAPAIFGYDPNTGTLIYSGYWMGDVLLEKVGIDFLYGGSLKLFSYSDNLNLEFFNSDIFWNQLNIRVLCFTSGLVLLVAESVIVVVYLLVRKIRKRRELRTLDTPNLHVNGKQN